jgi:hypothetical protein
MLLGLCAAPAGPEFAFTTFSIPLIVRGAQQVRRRSFKQRLPPAQLASAGGLSAAPPACLLCCRRSPRPQCRRHGVLGQEQEDGDKEQGHPAAQARARDQVPLTPHRPGWDALPPTPPLAIVAAPAAPQAAVGSSAVQPGGASHSYCAAWGRLVPRARPAWQRLALQLAAHPSAALPRALLSTISLRRSPHCCA